MKFRYSRHDLGKSQGAIERILEIVPGAVSWAIIISLTALSFFKPLFVAAVMVAFVLYWVLRLLYLNLFLIMSYFRLSIEKHTDWLKLIEGLEDQDRLMKTFSSQKASRVDLLKRLSDIIRRKQIEFLKQSGSLPPKPGELFHLVILPVVKETRDIIEPSIEGLAAGTYPSKRVLIVIALEERADDKVKDDAYEVRKRYQRSFMDLLIIEHPKSRPGEARVKGANVTFAARYAAEYFNERKIPFENVIVSCFDADTIARQDYLACLTYYYMITPDRTRASYQPIPVYHNNIWQVPSFARIIEIGTSFFQLVESTNAEKLVTFSSHSMSFKALVEVGYWPVDMISDDSAIFWKSFIHYDGQYRVVPIYTTVSMDIASGKDLWSTVVNIYRQKRRWAWGVENLPIVMRAFHQNHKIPLYKKFVFGLRLFDSFISWATWSFLLVFISWLPTVVTGSEFATSTVYYIAPRIKGVIFSLSSMGIVVCMVISLMLLPVGLHHRLTRKIAHIFEWVLIPVVILALSAIPALDAQTRLMLGRYLDFEVTDKRRSEN
jgi:hypothetical protein